MSIEITMPALSANMDAGTVARWLIREGDEVKCGDVIAEIETDKAVMEMQAKQDGVLARILVPEGSAAVKVGEAIALLSTHAGGLPAGSSTLAANDKSALRSRSVDSDTQDERTGVQSREASPASQTNNRRIKASPIARRLAREQGVDLSLLRGSGPGARIVKSDVEKVTSSGASRPVASTAAQAANTPHEVITLSNMRKAIARRLSHSKATIPHFYLTVDIRMDSLLKLRSELNGVLDVKISVNDMLIRALGVALQRVPDANVQYAGDQLYKFRRADVSVAVAVPGGLVTPIVRDCATKPVAAIASEMRALLKRARSGKLMPDEYEGGTASLSNLGMYGVKQFEAIINPPQALIVAVGACERRAVVVGDELQVATVMSATASFDHRAIDGAIGAEFMAALKGVIEMPLSMLV